jgi:hypothetical protein
MLGGEIDGWDIAEHCRNADPTLPVIYVTGYSFPQHRPVAGSRLFYKPYNAETMIAALNDLLGPRIATA